MHSSPLARACATASVVADALGASRWTEDNFSPPLEGGAAGVVVDARLGEWCVPLFGQAALQPCQVLSDRNSPGCAPAWVFRNLGVLEGLRKAEAAAEHPEDWAIFSQWCDPNVAAAVAGQAVANGESMEEVRLRAVTAVEDAAAATPDNGQPVIAVTHGGVLGQLLRHAVASAPQPRAEGDGETVLGLADQEFAHAANACIARFRVDVDETSPGLTTALLVQDVCVHFLPFSRPPRCLKEPFRRRAMGADLMGLHGTSHRGCRAD